MSNFGFVKITIGKDKKVKRQIDSFCRSHNLPLFNYSLRPEDVQREMANLQSFLAAVKASKVKKGIQAKWTDFLERSIFSGARFLALVGIAPTKETAEAIGKRLGAKVDEVPMQS